MARGKHKAAADRRRQADLEATLAGLRADIADAEKHLAAAQAAAAAVDDLADQLHRTKADRDRTVADEVARLSTQREFLAGELAVARGHQRACQHQWDRVFVAVHRGLGGGREGLEQATRLLGAGGILSDSPADLGLERLTRLQYLRGERRDLPTLSADHSAHPAQAMQGWLRNGHYRRLTEAGFTTTPKLVVPDTLTDTQAAVLAAVDAAADQLLVSHPGSLTTDALHLWHPLPYLTVDHPTHPAATGGGCAFDDLGHSLDDPHPAAAPPPASSTGAAGWPEPTPALDATTRTRLLDQSPEDLVDGWRDRLRAGEVLAAAVGRAEPWRGQPLVPRPSRAAVLTHQYLKSAIGAWSRTWESDPGGSGTRRRAHDAIALACAAPFWLPPGQAAAFADSEPLPGSDIADLALPYPQVLLTFAEPLRLDPTRPPTGAEQAVLSALDAKVADLTHADEVTPGTLIGTHETHLAGALSLDDVLAVRGGTVEAVLFTADALGRLTDEVTWCVAVGARATGCLGRFTVPATLAGTRWRDQLLNLAAVICWAGWHAPDPDTACAPGTRPRDVEGLVTGAAFRRDADRAGAGAVRVLDVKATLRPTGPTDPTGRHVAPHVRRGHWRRQRFGTGRTQVRRVRIAPVVVNAHRGAVGTRVYRLPGPGGDVRSSRR